MHAGVHSGDRAKKGSSDVKWVCSHDRQDQTRWCFFSSKFWLEGIWTHQMCAWPWSICFNQGDHESMDSCGRKMWDIHCSACSFTGWCDRHNRQKFRSFGISYIQKGKSRSVSLHDIRAFLWRVQRLGSCSQEVDRTWVQFLSSTCSRLWRNLCRIILSISWIFGACGTREHGMECRHASRTSFRGRRYCGFQVVSFTLRWVVWFCHVVSSLSSMVSGYFVPRTQQVRRASDALLLGFDESGQTENSLHGDGWEYETSRTLVHHQDDDSVVRLQYSLCSCAQLGGVHTAAPGKVDHRGYVGFRRPATTHLSSMASNAAANHGDLP